jgi:large subunit ribosomal protein L30
MSVNTATFKVKLVKSISGRNKKHIASVHGLGLKKIGQTAEVIDNPCTRGMANKASYLLEIIED